MSRGLRAAVCLSALVGLLGCGRVPWSAPSESGSPPSFPADSSMARIQQRGHLVVGVKYDTPPFGSFNPLTNQVEGFDADLGRELARVLFGDEEKAQLVEALSGSRIPLLHDDRVDVILSTMTISDERRQEIDFSEPYYAAGQSILVPRGSPIRGIDDLSGRTVASGQGSTSARTLRKQAPGARLLLVSAYPEALAALRDQRADAVSTDDTILMGMMLTNPDLQMVGGTFTAEPYGAGIKKGRPELVAFVNQVFDQLKANGRWTELYKRRIAPLSGFMPEPPR
jgi:aspartate/glutamate/glutamine transport system substrate-binding protein